MSDPQPHASGWFVQDAGTPAADWTAAFNPGMIRRLSLHAVDQANPTGRTDVKFDHEIVASFATFTAARAYLTSLLAAAPGGGGGGGGAGGGSSAHEHACWAITRGTTTVTEEFIVVRNPAGQIVSIVDLDNAQTVRAGTPTGPALDLGLATWRAWDSTITAIERTDCACADCGCGNEDLTPATTWAPNGTPMQVGTAAQNVAAVVPVNARSFTIHIQAGDVVVTWPNGQTTSGLTAQVLGPFTAHPGPHGQNGVIMITSMTITGLTSSARWYITWEAAA